MSHQPVFVEIEARNLSTSPNSIAPGVGQDKAGRSDLPHLHNRAVKAKIPPPPQKNALSLFSPQKLGSEESQTLQHEAAESAEKLENADGKTRMTDLKMTGLSVA